MNSVAELLERAALNFPDHVALEDEAGTMTYSGLRQAGRAAASAMLRAGVGGGSTVAVFLPKSSACVVAFYGALYCGASYAPLDFTAPKARIEQTLRALGPIGVITNEEGREKLSSLTLPACLWLDYDALTRCETDDDAVDQALGATIDLDPAYIMYTSGSTGTPKGVVVSHRSVLDYVDWTVHTFPITEDTIFGQQSGFHFDNSVFHIYSAVYSGATLVIIPDQLFRFPAQLVEYIALKQINYIFWAPTVLCSIANSGALDKTPLDRLRVVSFGGEVMPAKQLGIWRRALPDCTYVNMYGPTEITDVCCYYVVDREFHDDEVLPIGKTCRNMRVLILRDDDTLAADGEEGELCVLGAGVALGYWKDPAATERAFVPNPLNPYYRELMYRTGDRGYCGRDGLIYFCGRKDSQIKLRGNRIELGDVEAAARSVPGVDNACALFDPAQEKIVLFLETKESFILRKFNLELGNLLPKYMLPGKLVCLEAFPVNANRKVDRLRLGEMIK
jgi:amino acid adenylation domain-containing protein